MCPLSCFSLLLCTKAKDNSFLVDSRREMPMNLFKTHQKQALEIVWRRCKQNNNSSPQFPTFKLHSFLYVEGRGGGGEEKINAKCCKLTLISELVNTTLNTFCLYFASCILTTEVVCLCLSFSLLFPPPQPSRHLTWTQKFWRLEILQTALLRSKYDSEALKSNTEKCRWSY